MAVYNKQIKRSKDGRIVRYVGKNAKGAAEKFHLGFDMPEAEKRLKLITALWEANSQRSIHPDCHPSFYVDEFVWGDDYLRAAKAIAKGETPKLPPSIRASLDPENYLHALREISDATNTKWEATDEALKNEGIELAKTSVSDSRKNLSGRNDREAIGVSLDEAFALFEDYLRKEYHQPDDSLSTTGKKLVDQLKGIRRYAAESFTIKGGKKVKQELLTLDLAWFDLTGCQLVYDCIRKRPLSFRSDKTERVKFSSAQNMCKMITRFFDWLDTSDIDWNEPPKFRKIKKTIDPLDSNEQFQKQQAKKISVIPHDHLAIISKYCRPSERVLLLLGLNCAFGEGEVGQLRIPFINGNEIDGIRFKTGNPTRHHLWDETAEALQQTIQARPMIDNDKQVVFVASTGKPLWYRTKGGNYCNGIASRWNIVMKRVRKDHPDVPAYSFNKLRKTAATNILNLCSAESASMLLAHKTISDDELLECYVQMPWNKLYEAQRKWGEKILPYIKPNPLHINIGGGGLSVKKVAKIKELSDAGMSRAKIAKQLGVSWMTVNSTVKQFDL